MARTWNVTLTPVDGTHEVRSGISDDEMAHLLSSLVHGTSPQAPAQTDDRETYVETHEPIAA